MVKKKSRKARSAATGKSKVTTSTLAPNPTPRAIDALEDDVDELEPETETETEADMGESAEEVEEVEETLQEAAESAVAEEELPEAPQRRRGRPKGSGAGKRGRKKAGGKAKPDTLLIGELVHYAFAAGRPLEEYVGDLRAMLEAYDRMVAGGG